MIHKVEFQNFKALRDVSLDLERFTVLVGPNGSGKTSVLEGLYYLLELGPETLPQDFFQGQRAPQLLSTSGGEDEIVLACRGDERRLIALVGPNGSTLDWGFPDDDAELPHQLPRDCGRKKEFSGTPKFAQSAPTVFLRLDLNHLTAPSYK